MTKTNAKFPETSASRDIDQLLQQTRLSRRRTQEVLIVGIPGSGKTTFMRHMKAQYAPYTKEEREGFRPFLHASILGTLRKLFSIVGDDLLSAQISECRRKILSNEVLIITPSFAHIIHDWWATDAVRDAIPTFNLNKSALHFLDQIIPVSAPDYNSGDLDILLCETYSSPLDQSLLQVNEDRRIRSIFGVCPRQSLSSAHKWFNMFSDIENLVFVLNLDDYDNPENMRMSLDLFARICNSSNFRSTTIHVVLNRHDSFSSRLAFSPLTADYSDETDPDRAIQFVARRFTDSTRHRWSTRHWVVDLMDIDGSRG